MQRISFQSCPSNTLQFFSLFTPSNFQQLTSRYVVCVLPLLSVYAVLHLSESGIGMIVGVNKMISNHNELLHIDCRCVFLWFDKIESLDDRFL